MLSPRRARKRALDLLRFGVGGLALTLLGVSCKLAQTPSVCEEGLAAGDAGPSEAGAGDGGLDDGGAADGGQQDASYCASCLPPAACSTVENPSVVTVAGLAASALHAGAYYLHNGAPDVARFFAMDQAGADLGTYQVMGAANVDWEDLGVGPCPGGSCVFLADVGDARQVRGQYTVYRVAEPSTLAAGSSSVTADAFPFAYPDGSHDASAILVHPVTGVVTVITRGTSGADTQVYELPSALPGQPVTATPRGSLDVLGLDVWVTAASVRRDGRVLLRTNVGAAVFDAAVADAGTMPVSLAFQSAPCSVATADETDGEAIAWMGSGRGFLTIGRGALAPLDYVFCASP